MLLMSRLGARRLSHFDPGSDSPSFRRAEGLCRGKTRKPQVRLPPKHAATPHIMRLKLKTSEAFPEVGHQGFGFTFAAEQERLSLAGSWHRMLEQARSSPSWFSSA